MTQTFDLAPGQVVRKVEPGELLEVLEGPTADPETDLKRSRSRALRDGASGWISILGNKGGTLMKSAPKPIMTCTADVRLLEAFDPSSQELQKVKLGDVFELL